MLPPIEPSPAEIADAVGSSLASLPERLPPGRTAREWTKQLKEDIGTLGVDYGWSVCTAGFSDRFDCEWLYDLVWYRENADGRLSDVHLVLESEWAEGLSELKIDFEKLLVAKAPLKVMVFETNNRHLEERLSWVEGGIRAFSRRSASENYIVAAFNSNSHAFVIRQINGA